MFLCLYLTSNNVRFEKTHKFPLFGSLMYIWCLKFSRLDSGVYFFFWTFPLTFCPKTPLLLSPLLSFSTQQTNRTIKHTMQRPILKMNDSWAVRIRVKTDKVKRNKVKGKSIRNQAYWDEKVSPESQDNERRTFVDRRQQVNY